MPLLKPRYDDSTGREGGARTRGLTTDCESQEYVLGHNPGAVPVFSPANYANPDSIPLRQSNEVDTVELPARSLVDS